MMINVQGWFYVFKSRIKTTCMNASLLCEKDPFKWRLQSALREHLQSSLSAKIKNKFQVISRRKMSFGRKR